MNNFKLILINIYPSDTIARYLLSSYVIKAFLDSFFKGGADITVQVLNFSQNTQASKICDQIVRHKPDAVGYSCYVWNIETVFQVIKGLNDREQFIQILGGPEITVERIKLLQDNTLGNYFVIGEGEYKIASLIEYLMDKDDGINSKIPGGVAYWSNDRKEICYFEDKTVVSLEDVPSVYLQGTLDEELYREGQAFLETQRGCRLRCKYCVYHKGLPSISYYPIERVIKEIYFLIVEKKIAALRIFDAMFTSNLDRAKTIAKYLQNLKNDGIKLPWIYWEFDYRRVDEEFIRITASLKSRETINNCNSVEPLDRPQIYSDMLKDYTVINCFGIQSFNKDSLKTVGRPPINKHDFLEFMNLACQHNVVFKIDMILGLPFETLASYYEGLEFFISCIRNTDHVFNIHLLQILPGSELEKLCEEYGVLYSCSAPHTVFSTNSMSTAEFATASKITGILFRIVNSPLREHIFLAKERSGESYVSLAQKILDKIQTNPQFKNTRLVNEYIDDVYWNEEIFYDLPTCWLKSLLENI